MNNSEPNWSPWGHKRKQTDELLKRFGRQCRLHMEAELQHFIAREREMVLCDLVLHAEFINEWLEASQTGVDAGSQCKTQTPRPDHHPTGFLLPQGQLMPDSRTARLLRGTTLQQVQEVLRMTPQGWADTATSWFAEVMVQIEFLTRPDQSPAAAGAKNHKVPASSAAGSVRGARGRRQQQQQHQQAAYAPSCPGTAGSVAEAPPAACTHTAAVFGPVATAPTAAAHGAPASAAPGSPAGPPLQRSNSSRPRSLLQHPINVSPARAQEALVAVVNRATHMTVLTTVLGRMDQVTGEAVLTGGKLDPSFEHGEAVTDRLQLTELQELHLYICMEELERMNRSVVQEGSQLLHIAAEPTLQLAAARQTSVKSLQQRDGVRGLHPSNALRPLESSSELQDGLDSKLLRVSGKLHRNMVSAALFIGNTLSTHQLAVLFAACYPRSACVFGIANVAHKRVQQRQQALLSAIDASARQSGSIPASLMWLSQADLFALCAQGSSKPVAAATERGSEAAVGSSTSIAGYMLQEHM